MPTPPKRVLSVGGMVTSARAFIERLFILCGSGARAVRETIVWVGSAHGLTLLGVVLTVLTVLVAANQVEESRLGARANTAAELYFNVLGNLGNSDLVVRVGAIGSIPELAALHVPADSHPRLWEGWLFVLGAHHHPEVPAYHESVQRILRGLIVSPKQDGPPSVIESDALLDALCRMGAQGWYLGGRPEVRPREMCLAWVWQNALSDEGMASYGLFENAQLRGAVLRQMSLQRANFAGASFSNVSFENADLRGATFRGAVLDGVSFADADLEDVDFSQSSLEHVVWTGAKLTGVLTDGAVGSSRVPASLDPVGGE